MKLTFAQRHSRGFSLLVVMVIVTVALLILSGVMAWITSSSALTARRGEYYTSLGAAEAATEKVIATMAGDFHSASERSDFQGADLASVDGSLSTYQGQYPTAGDLSGVANYEFTGPSIGTDATYVSRFVDWGWAALNWKYTNYYGYAASYRVVSNARNTDSDNNIISAFKQDIQLASIPAFEFAIFYGIDMEFNPSSSATIGGPVHCNGTLYCTSTVTYQDDVTASGNIVNGPSPNDPTVRTPGTIVYQKEKDSGVSPLTLAIGTNPPSNLHQIIDIPLTADASTPLGQQRYYNKADLIILISTIGSNNWVTFIPGWAGMSYPEHATNYSSTNNFLRIDTNSYFVDRREGKTIQYTELDISQLATGQIVGMSNSLTSFVGHPPTNFYIADMRSHDSGHESGVRIINGQTLPGPLTIATQNPLYVKGDFNTNSPKSASLVGDAITVLSGSWDDANSTLSLASRTASDTTVNAGVLAGIVPSNVTYYGGGAENFFRLLENWSSRTLTVNGSIVVLFQSQSATGFWGTFGVYSPPSRNFLYDSNFKDSTKLPPGTPWLRTLIRDRRMAAQPNSTL